MIFLFCALLGQQYLETESEIWTGIARAEETLNRTVDGIRNEVMVFTSDPVRGYAVEGKGIFFVVPIRYKTPDVAVVDLEFPGSNTKGRDRALTREELNRAKRQWRQSLSKKRELEKANFERVVERLRSSIPRVLDQLGDISTKMPLILIVEEREPAWVYASFGPHTQPSRHVAILEISPRLAHEIRSGQTDWDTKVTREDSERLARHVAPSPK